MLLLYNYKAALQIRRIVLLALEGKHLLEPNVYVEIVQN